MLNKRKLVWALFYGVVVAVLGGTLEHGFGVTSPQAYFWLGSLSAWVAALTFPRQ